MQLNELKAEKGHSIKPLEKEVSEIKKAVNELRGNVKLRDKSPPPKDTPKVEPIPDGKD